MRRRTLLALLALGLAVAAVVVFILRRAAPPEPARMLPAADAFVYINLKPLRRANLLQEASNVKLDPEYAKFVQQTGFQFERDLDEAAFAVHYSSPPAVGSQPVSETRFSEVLVARFDATKVTDYLRSISAATETHHDVEIFNIPLPGRTLRVAVLDAAAVTASNNDDPAVIRGIIDRRKQMMPLTGGPELLRQYYHRVPALSIAWAIARLGRPGESAPMYALPGGLAMSVPPASAAVVSVRYTGSVQAKASVFTQNQADAKRIADQLSLLLAMFRSIESSAQPSGPDPDVKAFFDNLKVEQHGSQAELMATLPPGFLKKLVTESPSVVSTPQPRAEKAPQKRRSKRK